ncbi:MAG: hypothetical protein KDA85_12060 [Planctomycetaceae bacterium]|nr:hypothetical protein [Planctomycetaceae bacterium]
MGIGRRTFLQLFGAAISAAASVTDAIAIVDNYYVNRRLGIAFEKPYGWVFASIQQMADVKVGQILDLDDPEFAREIANSQELPILLISRDGISPHSDHFTPGITVFLDRLSPGKELTPDFSTLLKSAERDIENSQFILKNFRILSPPTETIVSDCPTVEYEASFVFEHVNMLPLRVRMKTLVVDQGAACYTLRMYDSPFAGDAMTFDYSDFIASIRMV